MAGICNTDLELVRGYYPFSGIPGHEFVGVVEEGPAELMGRRVPRRDQRDLRYLQFLSRGPVQPLNRTVLGIVNRNGAFADY